ncbi:MAG: hypothetical protein IJY39_14520 [Clostridia bacterium]|nr:hypothetical protein [Clostridia bacterium]
MFITKKKKIQKYLEKKAESDKNAFDLLLCNYLDGTLKTDLESLGITKNEIHVDWLDDIKCIGIQGRYKKYFADIQIYAKEFSISFDLDEPDDDISYALESKEQLYRVISEMVAKLK